MTNASGKQTWVKQTLHNAQSTIGIIFRTLIAPWPGFSLLLLIIATISGLVPLIQIKAITAIVDGLTISLQASGPQRQAPLMEALQPYLMWLLLFAGMQLIDLQIQSRTFLTYLGTLLDDRVRRQFYPAFLRKALSLQLERFEHTAYYDRMEHIREAFRRDMTEPLLELQRFVVVSIAMIVILWQLGSASWLVPLVLIPATISISRLRVKFGQVWWQINFAQTPTRRQQSYWRSLLTERLSASEVRLFGLRDYIITAWSRLSARRLQAYSSASLHHFYRQLPLLFVSAILSSSAFLILFITAQRGLLTPGQFVALLYAVWQYENEIGILGQRLESFFRLVMDLHAIEEFLALEGDEAKTGLAAPPPGRDGLRFANVSFVYPGSQHPVLKGIDLHIQPGEKIALVGENGAGKSTLAKLLLGLYQPTDGAILVDGTPLSAIDPASWRTRMGAVMQDFMRYSFTVRENIGFGQLARLQDDAAIQAAAVASGADGDIQTLPAQYDTLLGKEFEKGQELSRGQWQKLAIARAHLRDADVVVLDEPTSALDPLAELEIYQQFLSLAAGKTVLLISHRLGSAQLADRIVFLEQGRILETGTHEQLIAAGGAYATLYTMQAEWYRERGAQEVVFDV